MSILTALCGGTTAASARFRVHIDTAGPVAILIADNPELEDAVTVGPEAVDADGYAALEATGLIGQRRYWWSVDEGATGTPEATRRTFYTPPTAGIAADFVYGYATCQGLNPSHPASAGGELRPDRLSDTPALAYMAQMAVAENWASFDQGGDLAYYDGMVDDGGGTEENFRRQWHDALRQPNMQTLLESAAFGHEKDDHDGGPNNHSGTYTGIAACNATWRQAMPHYDLPDAGGTYYSRIWGRVEILTLDVRSYRSPNSTADTPSKTMLGATQEAWVAGRLASSPAEFFIFETPSQWATGTADSWGNFQYARERMIEAITANGRAGRVAFVTGDTHSMYMQTEHYVHPEAGPTHGPSVAFASIDSSPSGGSASDTGPNASQRGQFGTIAITDDGFSITVTFRGWQTGDGAHAPTLWREMSYTVTTTLPQVTYTPDTIQRLVAGSHRALIEARLVPAGQTGDDPDGIPIQVQAGDVQYNATADIYATASLTTKTAWPRLADDPAAPYGTHELWLARGIDTGASPLMVPLGYFRLDDVDQDDAARGPLALDAPDRMAAIRDARFLAPRQILAGRTIGAIVRELVHEVLPSAVVFFDDAYEFATLGRSVVVLESRLKIIQELARAGGKVAHFDNLGRLVFRTPAAAGLMWEVAAGRGGVLIKASRRLSRTGVRNLVVARGEGADMTAPVQAIAADMNPKSPTYVHGPFGPVPRFYSSPLITSTGQAYATAESMLGSTLGLAHNAKLTAVCNPAVRPWDAARVTTDDGSRERHVFDQVTVPLNPAAALTATTREQTRVMIRRYR